MSFPGDVHVLSSGQEYNAEMKKERHDSPKIKKHTVALVSDGRLSAHCVFHSPTYQSSPTQKRAKIYSFDEDGLSPLPESN